MCVCSVGPIFCISFNLQTDKYVTFLFKMFKIPILETWEYVWYQQQVPCVYSKRVNWVLSFVSRLSSITKITGGVTLLTKTIIIIKPWTLITWNPSMFGSLKTRASVYVTDFFDKLPALAKESDFVLYHLFIMEGSLVKSPPPHPSLPLTSLSSGTQPTGFSKRLRCNGWRGGWTNTPSGPASLLNSKPFNLLLCGRAWFHF